MRALAPGRSAARAEHPALVGRAPAVDRAGRRLSARAPSVERSVPAEAVEARTRAGARARAPALALVEARERARVEARARPAARQLVGVRAAAVAVEPPTVRAAREWAGLVECRPVATVRAPGSPISRSIRRSHSVSASATWAACTNTLRRTPRASSTTATPTVHPATGRPATAGGSRS